MDAYLAQDYELAKLLWIYHYQENTHREYVIEILLRLNDLNTIVGLYRLSNIDDYIDGLTLLYRSVKYRLYHVIKRLIRYGADPHKECLHKLEVGMYGSPYNYAKLYNEQTLINVLSFKMTQPRSYQEV